MYQNPARVLRRTLRLQKLSFIVGSFVFALNRSWCLLSSWGPGLCLFRFPIYLETDCALRSLRSHPRLAYGNELAKCELSKNHQCFSTRHPGTVTNCISGIRYDTRYEVPPYNTINIPLYSTVTPPCDRIHDYITPSDEFEGDYLVHGEGANAGRCVCVKISPTSFLNLDCASSVRPLAFETTLGPEIR